MKPTEQFNNLGFAELGEIQPEACGALLEHVRSSRTFGPELFYTEEAFERENPDGFNKNPRPGCNLLDDLEDQAAAIEQDPTLVSFLEAALGKGYTQLRRKLVCSATESWVPQWIQKRVAGQPSNNLAHYVLPQYTDITYFFGIDFHQDLVDWNGREPDFLTLYVYLGDVADGQAPLFVLPRSFELGADLFPHDVVPVPDKEGRWTYTTRQGLTETEDQVVLVRPQGSAFAWHSLTLHGTQPATTVVPRISMRYLLVKGEGPCLLDEMNKRIRGPLTLESLREDLDDRNLAQVRENHLFDARGRKQAS